MTKQKITKIVSPNTGIATNKNNTEGSPLIRLIGDEFCTTAESSLYLLGSTASAIGGTALTENGTPTYPFDSDLGENVVSLDGSTDYLTLPTESSVEVGTGSFVASIQFKTNALAGANHATLFHYGDVGASEQNWFIRIDGTSGANGGRIYLQIDDGTNIQGATSKISYKDEIIDDNWHTLVWVVDRTQNIQSIYLDGKFVELGTNEEDISNVTGTLNNVGTSFWIGRRNDLSYFNGSLANFHLIKSADYNAVQVLNQGIRESVCKGVATVAVQTLNRLNNQFTIPSADTNYTTTVIDIEEGLYELQLLGFTDSSQGIVDLIVDGNVIATKDNYSAGATRNVLTSFKDISLSAGKHILKLLVNDNNISSSGFQIITNWISFIKRDGHENGGCHKFLLLGDEIVERNPAPQTFLQETAGEYNNSFRLISTSAEDLDYTEGSVFLKGGVWRIDILYSTLGVFGILDIKFGDVLVFDQLDCWSSGSVRQNVKGFTVRLPQGKTLINITVNGKNGSATDYGWDIQAIRGERIAD